MATATRQRKVRAPTPVNDQRGYFQHRPICRGNPRCADLLALEVPDCTCAYEPPHFPPDHDDPEGVAVCRRSRSWLALHRLLVVVCGRNGQPSSEPCKHTEEPPEAARDPLMKWWPTLVEWAEMLREYDRAGYDDPPLDPRGGTIVVEPDVRIDRYHLRARAGWAVRHPADVLWDERFAVLGAGGRHDVRAHGDGLCGARAAPGEREAKAVEDEALWDEVQEEMARRDARSVRVPWEAALDWALGAWGRGRA